MPQCIPLFISDQWKEYALIDSGNGRRLEKYGPYLINRPDPQAIWSPSASMDVWKNAQARFVRDTSNHGTWNTSPSFPAQWHIAYRDLTFICRLTPFKHTGIFPEQASNWDWLSAKITSAGRPVKVLNLFGYTGGATLAAAAAGAHVTHVDASYPAIGWARENQKMSGLEQKPVRWIEDDVMAFVRRDIRRKATYDAVVMDPPIYGHGPKGEIWDFGKSFPELMRLIDQILTPNPLFVIVNAYAISASALMLQHVVEDILCSRKGTCIAGELVIRQSSGRILSTGLCARWHAGTI